VAPGVDNEQKIKEALGCRPAGAVHHSQILKDDPYEFQYRRMIRPGGVPQAFLFVEDLGTAGGNIDEALKKVPEHVGKRDDLIPINPGVLGIADATNDRYRLGKYQNKCAFTLGRL
jgi:hypothetical protein